MDWLTMEDRRIIDRKRMSWRLSHHTKPAGVRAGRGGAGEDMPRRGGAKERRNELHLARVEWPRGQQHRVPARSPAWG